MTENDMNEQPTGEQPAEGAAHPTSAPAAGESAGWRPPSEQAPAASQPAAGIPANAAPTSAPPAGDVPSTPAENNPVANNPVPTTEVPTTQMPASQTPASPYVAPPPYAPTSAQPQSPYAPPSGYTPGSAYPMGPAETPTANYPTAGTATSSYPATGTHEGKRRGFGVGTLVATGVLALVLAGGGGVAGAAIMHHYDKNDTTVSTTSDGKVVSNAPIIDRSSLASIASAVSPSVVSIATSTATGSGVILSKDGYILTNNHVAATASGQSVEITFSDGSTAKATLVGTDPKTDLAVYKAQNVSDLRAAKFGDSAALQVGDTVLAIGAPLGLDGTVTAGIVSALNRTIDESSEDSQPQDPNDPLGQSPSQQSTTQGPTIAGAIQTDASINPGNSGGALVNTNGEVVGINTAIATNGGAEGSIGVGFSIPSNRANQVANDIIKGVAVSHPQLGIGVATATDNAGAQVQSVVSGSAADKAGLKADDVITKFDGKAVHTQDDLLNDIQSATVGTPYAMTIDRGGQSMDVSVTLQESK
jgi:putative serine protease PepD